MIEAIMKHARETKKKERERTKEEERNIKGEEKVKDNAWGISTEKWSERSQEDTRKKN